MSDEIDALKKNKSVVGNSYTLDVLNHISSATPTPASDTHLGMLPGYFVGQTPPPSMLYIAPVGPVPANSTPKFLIPSLNYLISNFAIRTWNLARIRVVEGE